MAPPAIPTASSLATEGLRQARIFNPTPSQIALYSGEVMEQAKNDLWTKIKSMKPLMNFSYGVLTIGQSRYSCPQDFSSDLTMTILDGFNTGQAGSGTVGTITLLPAAAPLQSSDVIGKEILITGGTGQASGSQITGYTLVGQTVTLTVTPNFDVAPDLTSTYLIVDSKWPVKDDHIANLDEVYRPAELSRPRKYYSMGDEDFDEFEFDCAPDKAYGVKYRYYINIMTLDLSSTLMTTLYQKFRDYWIKYVKAIALADQDDSTADAALVDAGRKLQDLIMSQQYGTDIHGLAQRVTDYQ